MTSAATKNAIRSSRGRGDADTARRLADLGEIAADIADELLDAGTHLDVAVDAFAAGGGQLHHHRVVRVETLRQQFRQRREADVDTFGEVETVDAQHDRGSGCRVRHGSRRPGRGSPGPGLASSAAGVDGDGERADAHGAETHLHHTEPGTHPDGAFAGGLTGQPPSEVQEVLRTARQVESDQVGAEQTFDDLGAPRVLQEQLDRGNGICRKKPIRRSGRSIRSILGTS